MRYLVRCLFLAPILIATPLIAQAPSRLLAAQLGRDEANALLAFYPSSDVAHSRSAAAVIKLTIAPNGKVIACDLIDQIGHAGLAERICGFSKRVKWSSARDRDGHAAFGIATTIVKFAIPGTPQGESVQQAQREPDVIAKLAAANSLPGGSADVKVSLQIGPTANIIACEPSVPTGSSLTSQACSVAEKLKFDVLNGPGNAPVGYVTERIIRLVADGADPQPR